jgi:hypothetical protein
LWGSIGVFDGNFYHNPELWSYFFSTESSTVSHIFGQFLRFEAVLVNHLSSWSWQLFLWHVFSVNRYHITTEEAYLIKHRCRRSEVKTQKPAWLVETPHIPTHSAAKSSSEICININTNIWNHHVSCKNAICIGMAPIYWKNLRSTQVTLQHSKSSPLSADRLVGMIGIDKWWKLPSGKLT